MDYICAILAPFLEMALNHRAVMTGLALTIVLGWSVAWFTDSASESLRNALPPPRPTLSSHWEALYQKPDGNKRKTAGAAIGSVERIIFFASFTIQNALPLLAAWLVFKLALYWQSTNFGALPEKDISATELEYLLAKRRLGEYHVQRLMVGTGANILVALIGATIAKWVKL